MYLCVCVWGWSQTLMIAYNPVIGQLPVTKPATRAKLLSNMGEYWDPMAFQLRYDLHQSRGILTLTVAISSIEKCEWSTTSSYNTQQSLCGLSKGSLHCSFLKIIPHQMWWGGPSYMNANRTDQIELNSCLNLLWSYRVIHKHSTLIALYQQKQL